MRVPASACSAGSARRSSMRCSANATGHHVVSGLPVGSSTTAASWSYAFSRVSAIDAEPERRGRRIATRFVGGRRRLRQRARLRRCRHHPRRSARPRRRSPISPSASAALPRISGDESASAAISGSRALRSPISPSANAAICRTSGSASRSSSTSGGTPAADPRGRRRAPRAAHTRFARRSAAAADPPRRPTRIASTAHVFELQNPRHLLFEERDASATAAAGAGGGGGALAHERRASATAAINERARDATPRGRGGHERDDIIGSALQFRHIAIEGPIGAGKTALTERLGTRLDATVVLEETDNPFLADFYADRPGAALQAQLFYLLNRHRQQVCAASDGSLQPDHGLRLPLRQGQDLRVSESRRQRAVHLSAAVRAARERHPLARSRHLSAGADRCAAPARAQPARRRRGRRAAARR